MESSTPPTGPTGPAAYEFGASQDAVIGDTARWVGIWSWFALVLGTVAAISGLVSLPGGFGSLALGIVYIVIGVYFRGAGRSLQSVVETEGDDIAHLMSALGSLRSAFRVMVIITALGFVAGVVAAFMEGGM